MHDMQKLYRLKGVATDRLKTAAFRYATWLKEQKAYIAHRRNLSYNVIDDQILLLLQSGEFNNIIQNHKLTTFLQKLFLENQYFDYYFLSLLPKNVPVKPANFSGK